MAFHKTNVSNSKWENEKKQDYHTVSCIGEQSSIEFDLTFGDVLLHKLVQAY